MKNQEKSRDIEKILRDYYLINLSRNLSVLGRKDVLSGKGKFGIFGDGKELAQVAMAHQFRNGDWRSGYYRDQTFMIAAGMYSAHEFFSSLYGTPDIKHNPSHGGRSFNNHFGTRNIDENGDWRNLMNQKNSSADISPTAGQMPRLLGLAYASKIYRNAKELHKYEQFSNKGDEVAFGTIGDASTSEGHFWETMNAAAVLQVPMAISIWDDGYGISVPKKYQTVKESISEALRGFEKNNDGENGILIYKAKGWDYPELMAVYEEGIKKCREKHIPVLFHIEEVSQPQGHSTSGSHERYKSAERLQWEVEFDPIKKMKEWLLAEKIANEQQLVEIEQKAEADAKHARNQAWDDYTKPMIAERDKLINLVENKGCICKKDLYDKVSEIAQNLKLVPYPIRKDNFSSAKKILRHICTDCPQRQYLQTALSSWLKNNYDDANHKYHTHLYSETPYQYKNVEEIKPIFYNPEKLVPGREILRDNFNKLFEKYPTLVTFGEDTGKIGDVNQGLEGLQEKFGEYRITDTGIRETTILGQAIGVALRGLRPIAEMQYFDYLLYALQTMSDDLATTLWRTAGGQKAPVIVRTRGHRLEGIWHSGSPISMVINAIRGMLIAVPRNMTQAAGIYNTLLQTDEPALVIEPLNGYRLRESIPQNIGQYTIPLGQPEILVEGSDITIVTYGSCVRIAQEAVEQLKEFKINAELIDVQTLIPFDDSRTILNSIRKTNRVLFFDEDFPGGATAFMMQKIVEEHGGYKYLDSQPATLTAKEHRPAFGTDGDYFSNPNSEDVFEKIYDIMHESNPTKYPKIY